MALFDRGLLAAAGALAEPALRALDAIHVAAGADLSPLDAFVSYDERQGAAARLAGLAHRRTSQLSLRPPLTEVAPRSHANAKRGDFAAEREAQRRMITPNAG